MAEKVPIKFQDHRSSSIFRREKKKLHFSADLETELSDQNFCCEIIPDIKVLILGDTNTGKTCITKRLMEKTYNDNEKPTPAYEISSKKVIFNNKVINFILSDLSGKVEFRDLIPIYLRNIHLVILTASIDELSSFESIPKWIEKITDITGELPIILCINKIDLTLTKDLTDVIIEEIPYITSKFPFDATFFVSAKNNENISELEKFVLKAAYENYSILYEKSRTSLQENDLKEEKKKCC